jgi:DNA invertase Pin-like site-specific DNA recombinase
VVVYKVDRLSRSLLDFAQVMDFFSRRGVAFVSVTQSFSTSDSIGKLTLALLVTFASFERDMISERTRDKIAAARRRGKWTGGSVPLGYEVRDKHLVVNELEAVRVREIFEIYLQHGSALAVASALNQAGHKTKRHEAKNGKVREGRAWNKADVLRILRNPVYAGCKGCGGELYKAEHEGLVDRAVFDRVQALLDNHSGTTRPPVHSPAYLLRGILKCGLWGRALTAGSNRTTGRTGGSIGTAAASATARAARTPAGPHRYRPAPSRTSWSRRSGRSPAGAGWPTTSKWNWRGRSGRTGPS